MALEAALAKGSSFLAPGGTLTPSPPPSLPRSHRSLPPLGAHGRRLRGRDARRTWAATCHGRPSRGPYSPRTTRVTKHCREPSPPPPHPTRCGSSRRTSTPTLFFPSLTRALRGARGHGRGHSPRRPTVDRQMTSQPSHRRSHQASRQASSRRAPGYPLARPSSVAPRCASHPTRPVGCARVTD